MHPFSRLLPAALLALSGCATIVNGGSQIISVNTVPMGATCVAERNGQRVGLISPTPGIFATNKSRKTILMACEKPGYQSVLVSNPAHSTFAVLGNVIFGGPLGLIIDESTGSDYEYVSTMNIDMPPLAPPLYDTPGARVSVRPTPLPAPSRNAWQPTGLQVE